MAEKPQESDRIAAANLLDYWFAADPDDSAAMQAQRRRWFVSTADQDRELAERFGRLASDAAAGLLDAWQATARGRLALVILLDQLPRNLYRGQAAAFAQDARALALALEGADNGHVDELAPLERAFLHMPLQHAESLEYQQLGVERFRQLTTLRASAPVTAALVNFADYAVVHRDIVARFGRFPHRNAALGRPSTDAEFEYLAADAPSFGQ